MVLAFKRCLPGAPRRWGLRALDALEAAEVPAFLQARSDARQLLSEGAGQPGKESLHLGGVNLQTQVRG